MKILVVDDMISMRHVMMHMLRDLGYNDLGEASDGVQALDKLKKDNYDVLITDYYMPNINGKQLLERIRHNEKLKELPVLMVSCEDDQKKIKSLIEAKVTGFIVKPFTANTLKKQLNWIKSMYDKKKASSNGHSEICIE
ncbi:MAG: two-component system response regulator [Gammaproteobacteria bacterium]|nr:MAG: two-component system response regulator [Gammaproteobacteria bacterium]